MEAAAAAASEEIICLSGGDSDRESAQHHSSGEQASEREIRCVLRIHFAPTSVEKWARGLPYMKSAVGGGRGVPKKQTKGQRFLE